MFGSTAKGNYKNDSDIDLLEISKRINTKAKKRAEALTGMKLQIFRISEEQFYKKSYNNVIGAALETGFPVCQREFFYERAPIEEDT